MIRNENKKDESRLIKTGIDENHRIKRFQFVHELLNRYVSGAASEKEKRILSVWKPNTDKGVFPLPNKDDEREAESKIYRKVAEIFERATPPSSIF